MKALIAMSGGVDSSVAVSLAKSAGYEVLGCTLLLCEGGEAGVLDAEAVAKVLEIPFFSLDWKEAFRQEIILPFIESYRRGMTPNPCVLCNKKIKFGRLLEEAQSRGCDRLITGHYARIEKKDGHYYLKKAKDPQKDQSYMLYNLKESELPRLSFPLGEYTKEEIRQMAEALSLPVAGKKDSQDICFVENGRYAELVIHEGGPMPIGDYVDTEGKILGKHKGLLYYTVGQHKRLGISFSNPMYVLALNAEKNQVVLGSDEELYTTDVLLPSISWVSSEGAPPLPYRCHAKIRYRQSEQPATVYPYGDGGIRIVFDTPQRAVTSGQSAVLYDGDTVLGGGIIDMN